MRTFRKNEKALGLIILVLLFIWFLNSFIIAPLRERLNTTEQDISRAKLVIRKYFELEQKRESILRDYKNIERYLNFKGSEDEKTTAILSKIEAEAHGAGLTILDLKPDTALKPKIFPTTYRIQLSAEADIPKVFNFIYNLENSDILFKIEKLNLSVKDENTGTIRLDANILGISFS